MGKPTYLQRRNGVYYVTRKVPKISQISLKKQYVKRSLRTTDYSVAKIKMWKVLQELESLFDSGAEDKVDHRSSPPLLTSPLSEVIEAWIADRSGRWSQSMKDDVGFVMPVVIRIIGNKPVSEISRADVRSMKDKVSRLPKNFTKLRLTRNRTIDDAILAGELKRLPRLSNASVNRYIGHLHTLMEWCVHEQIILTNPAKGLLTPRIRRHSEHQTTGAESAKRQQFSIDDIQVVMRSPEMSGDDWYNNFYWPTLIALYQGCRRTEILQLRTADIVCIDDIHCLYITDKGPGQKIKNRASERTIPVHSYLVEHSFLEFVEQTRERIQDRLFEWIKPDRNGRFGSYSKQYGSFLRRLGLGHVVFHSYRHSWRSQMYQAPKEIAQRLGGWTSRGVSEQYGDYKNIRENRDWINRISFR